MPAQRILSARQTEILLTYMESHKDFAKGRVSQGGGPLSKQNVKNCWARLAERLNCVGSGATKSPGEWRIYWNNLKYKARSKATQKKKHMGGTGGGPAWEKGDLTEQKWRIMNILGRESIFGEKSVRIPFPEPATNSTEDFSDDHRSAEPSHVEQNMEAAAVPLVASPRASPLPPSPSFQAPVSQIIENTSSPAMSSTPARQESQPTRLYVRRTVSVPDIPDWARQVEEANTAAQVRTAQALEGILEMQRQIFQVLNKRLPQYQME